MTKHKVTLVDDEKLFVNGLKLIIEQEADLEVVYQAHDGQALLDMMKEESYASDVTLLDLSMPVLDGVDTLRIIDKEYPETKVIILSSHYNDSIILKLLEEGASGFLAKGADPDEVILTIRRVIEHGFYINEHILSLVRNKRVLSRSKEEVKLSEREKEIMVLICNEFTTKEIAEKLFISPRTVDGHRNRILEKTGCKNLAGIVIYAIEHNIYEVNISKFEG